MLRAKITGIASYVPDYVLTNDELSQMVDTNDEWITTRVGIKERRILKEKGTGSSDLGYRAVARLIEKTGIRPEEIDLIICATSNPDYRFPSTASIIAEKLGIKTTYGYDLEAACAGFIVSLQAAAAYVQAGIYKKVIVVAAEKNVVNDQLQRPLDVSALWRRCWLCIDRTVGRRHWYHRQHPAYRRFGIAPPHHECGWLGTPGLT